MKKILVFLFVLIFSLTGCSKKPDVIHVAEQFGTAYAPVQIMKLNGYFENRLPKGTQVEWSQLGNTAAIREAMLAGEAQLAFMAIPPFLIGANAGMEWEIVCGLSSVPMGLVSRDTNIHTLTDITPQHRIALPQPGSIQHILLSMAAKRELGNAAIFDNQLVTLSHPDAMSALLSGGDVDMHFTAPPYMQTELDSGMNLVISGNEAMGSDFTFIVGVSDSAFKRDHPKEYEAFVLALEEAIDFINTQPEVAAELLAPVYGMEQESLLAQLTAEGVSYSTEVKGLQTFYDFLLEARYIENLPLDPLYSGYKS